MPVFDGGVNSRGRSVFRRVHHEDPDRQWDVGAVCRGWRGGAVCAARTRACKARAWCDMAFDAAAGEPRRGDDRRGASSAPRPKDRKPPEPPAPGDDQVHVHPVHNNTNNWLNWFIRVEGGVVSLCQGRVVDHWSPCTTTQIINSFIAFKTCMKFIVRVFFNCFSFPSIILFSYHLEWLSCHMEWLSNHSEWLSHHFSMIVLSSELIVL